MLVTKTFILFTVVEHVYEMLQKLFRQNLTQRLKINTAFQYIFCFGLIAQDLSGLFRCGFIIFLKLA